MLLNPSSLEDIYIFFLKDILSGCSQVLKKQGYPLRLELWTGQ